MTRHQIFLLASASALLTAVQTIGQAAFHPDKMETVLYGAAYYPEYMPYERLDKDVELMKQAGISVVRLGESSWGLWEPEDGRFEYAWMDRVVEQMHKAGIKVIMGTPTYSIPAWMYKKHPVRDGPAIQPRHVRDAAECGSAESDVPVLLRTD